MHSSAVDLLARAVRLVERDAPMCAELLELRLSGVDVAILLDGELAVLRKRGRIGAAASRDDGIPTVDVTTTSGAVLGLVTGEDELLPAVLANRVRVRVEPARAAGCFELVSALIEGCARSPKGGALVDELRERAERNSHG